MMRRIIPFLFSFLILFLPLVSFSAGLIPCDGADCDFNKFIELINNVINFLLFRLALPIAAISFAYAGFLLVTSGGSESKKTEAKNIFTGVAIGFIIAVAAWLIVNTILAIFSPTGQWSWIGFN